MFYNKNMANADKPYQKKKYEKPSITDPETGRSGPRINYGPVGATSCAYGAIGSACVNGNSPQIKHPGCNQGGSPRILNCSTGTAAGSNCLSGTDATTGCNTGTRDTSFCQNGSTAQGTCSTGTTVM